MKELTIPEETWVKVSDYCDELRKLNAELLQALIETLPYAKNWIGDNDSSIKWAESIVAKAEKQLNEHTT